MPSKHVTPDYDKSAYASAGPLFEALPEEEKTDLKKPVIDIKYGQTNLKRLRAERKEEDVN